jgi:hypothetical protein
MALHPAACPHLGDGAITLDEIKFAMSGADKETKVQTYLRSVQCPVLNALASRDPQKTRRAFDKMDTAKRFAFCAFIACADAARASPTPSSLFLPPLPHSSLGFVPSLYIFPRWRMSPYAAGRVVAAHTAAR